MDAAQEFDRFVAQAGPRLLRSAWLLTAEWAAAEDLVQTGLEKLWPHWPRLTDDSQRAAYLHRIMVTAYLRGRRRRWIGEQSRAELPETATGDVYAALEVRATVLAALARLPPRQRAVVVLRYFADLTEAATAEVMGCSVGTVKSSTARAFTALRQTPGLGDLLRHEVSE